MFDCAICAIDCVCDYLLFDMMTKRGRNMYKICNKGRNMVKICKRTLKNTHKFVLSGFGTSRLIISLLGLLME